MKETAIEILNTSIEKKLTGWDRTRHNRLNASERLKKYDDRWSVLMLFMNMMAVIFVFLSFVNEKNQTTVAVISGCYSTYVLILQYFLATRNYNARSLKLHYEQLEIESLRSELKSVELSSSMGIEQKKEVVKLIIQRYQTSLLGSENHAHIDDLKYMKGKRMSNHLEEDDVKRGRWKSIISFASNYRPIDFTLDNILIYFNVLAFIGVLITMFNLY